MPYYPYYYLQVINHGSKTSIMAARIENLQDLMCLHATLLQIFNAFY